MKFKLPTLLFVSLLSSSFLLGLSSATAMGNVVIDSQSLEVPYVSGCCAFIDDPNHEVHYTIYRPTEFKSENTPVIVDLTGRRSSHNLDALLALHGFFVLTMNTHESENRTAMRAMARNLGGIMAFIRDNHDKVKFDYSVVTDNESLGVALAMGLLPRKPSSLVLVGTADDWSMDLSILKTNYLQILSVDVPAMEAGAALSIISVRANINDPESAHTYGDFEYTNASRLELVSASQEEIHDSTIVMDAIREWILDTYPEFKISETSDIDDIMRISELLGIGALGFAAASALCGAYIIKRSKFYR